MCAAFSDNNITYDSYLSCVGALDKNTLFKIMYNIINGDIARLLTTINDIAEKGKNLTVLAKDLTEIIRNCLIVKNIKDYASILKLPESLLSNLKKMSEITDDNFLLKCMEKFSSIESELKYALNPRLLIETTCLQLAFISLNKSEIISDENKIITLEKELKPQKN